MQAVVCHTRLGLTLRLYLGEKPEDDHEWHDENASRAAIKQQLGNRGLSTSQNRNYIKRGKLY